jgi:coenzyme F420-reducing hydrogenase delta subunit
VHAFVASADRRRGEVVAICCDHGAAGFASVLMAEGAAVLPVSCAGNLHTTVVELLLRSGAGGVLVLACPPRDCWNREGPRWLGERIYQGREAELQPRVPRGRVRVAHANAHERRHAVAELRAFSADVATLGLPARDVVLDVESACDTAETTEAVETAGPVVRT